MKYFQNKNSHKIVSNDLENMLNKKLFITENIFHKNNCFE